MRIERLPFDDQTVKTWTEPHGRHHNWPVVYTLNDKTEVYVGETLNAVGRLRQHLDNPEKSHLSSFRVVLDDTFNKSVCLDLESYLIRLFAGDGPYTVLNRNVGITDSDYYERARYQALFAEIFDQLRGDGLFSKSIDQIENSDLFKLSPFKALNHDQESAIVDILEGLFDDLEKGVPNSVVIQGEPGTGKTIVAIYLMKLLQDIAASEPSDDASSDSVFSDFFVEGHRELLKDFRVGLVVPQRSLRKSIQKVFRKVPGLRPSMVMGASDVANSRDPFDLLLVDEAHRLGRYGANPDRAGFEKQSRAVARPGENWRELTQLDWIERKSKQRILLLDREQTVRPLDLSKDQVDRVLGAALRGQRKYTLRSQMRVAAGSDYIGYVRTVLDGGAGIEPRAFGAYDLRLFDSLPEMRQLVFDKDREFGLARVVAGFAWEWVSQREPDRADIKVDGLELFWNRAREDWINSPTSLEEVGSIHTVQGYDLNYAGVIVGPDLFWDQASRRVAVNRSAYADSKGKEGSPTLGVTVDDEALLSLVKNIYRVLLTRGMKGTYVYVCDPALRAHLRPFLTP